MRFTIKGYHRHATACKAAMWLAQCANTFLLLYVCAVPMSVEAAPQPVGKWQVAPSSGEEFLTLSLKAEKPVKGWMKTSVPTMTIQCSKGKAALYIETEMALEVTMIDQQIVRVQLDDNKPIPQRWREATNAMVAANARDAAALIEQFTRSQKFIFEFTPFNVSPVQAEFAVAGLSAYSAQLSKACGKK